MSTPLSTGPPVPVEIHDYVAPDWILSLLHDFCVGLDDSDTAVLMTISSGGSVIAGTVVPYRRWRQHHLDGFAAAGLETRLVALFVTAFAHTDSEEADLLADREDHGLALPDFTHIHMLDATIFTGAGALAVPTWRGRMDSIDGWSLGVPRAA